MRGPLSKAHALIAIAMIWLGAYPFISGTYAQRSLMWNGAAVVLLICGFGILTGFWRPAAPPGTSPEGRR